MQAQEAASRLRTVVAALDQAVVLTATGSGVVEVNGAAAGLLGLRRNTLEPAELSVAMRALRGRAVDPASLDAEAERLLTSPTSVVRDWVWALRGSPSQLRVSTVPVETVTGPGRVWVFDDISAEMALVESERRVGPALADSEQRYRLLAEDASDVVVQGDADGSLVWVSPSADPGHGVDTVGPGGAPCSGTSSTPRTSPWSSRARSRLARGAARWHSRAPTAYCRGRSPPDEHPGEAVVRRRRADRRTRRRLVGLPAGARGDGAARGQREPLPPAARQQHRRGVPGQRRSRLISPAIEAVTGRRPG